jgi:DNA mismatch repair ATPase MutS
LHRNGALASQAIGALARIGYWIDARGGLIAKMLELPFLYTVQVGLAAETWRRKYGRSLRAWVEITGEVEALISLAAYSYEHPADPFPVFVEASEARTAQPVFDGEELGHPLIPAAKCVRNSVRLNAETRVMLVSGSNMSGKSTFLRTAGINAVLAMAGAPVRGTSLRMTPVTLGSSIRRVDSLQENRSSFFTEILRIRDVFELTEGSAPVLFLFDELMEGTNSNDRKIGAEGLFRALLERRAAGIVTTHDLALTEITGAHSSVVRNVHFQDYVDDGKMRFDHKLRDGVVAKSNALELMRLIGLKV